MVKPGGVYKFTENIPDSTTPIKPEQISVISFNPIYSVGNEVIIFDWNTQTYDLQSFDGKNTTLLKNQERKEALRNSFVVGEFCSLKELILLATFFLF